MEQFFDTGDMLYSIVHNNMLDILKGFKGTFIIKKIEGTNIKIKSEQGNETILELTQTVFYGLLKNDKIVNKKASIKSELLCEEDFITYVTTMFNLKDSFDNQYNKVISHVLKVDTDKKLAKSFSYDIEKETEFENNETELSNDITFISGKDMINQSLESTSKGALKVSLGTLTHKEIENAYKSVNKKYDSFIKLFKSKGFDQQECVEKASNMIGSNLLLKIYSPKYPKGAMVITEMSPASVKKKHSEITKIETCMFTNLFLRYKKGEIKTKSEFLDLVYQINTRNKK